MVEITTIMVCLAAAVWLHRDPVEPPCEDVDEVLWGAYPTVSVEDDAWVARVAGWVRVHYEAKVPVARGPKVFHSSRVSPSPKGVIRMHGGDSWVEVRDGHYHSMAITLNAECEEEAKAALIAALP